MYSPLSTPYIRTLDLSRCRGSIRLARQLSTKLLEKCFGIQTKLKGEIHTKMMQPFVNIADGLEDLRDVKGVDRYRIDIKNSLQFDLAVGYLAGACMFRQNSRILLSTKELTGLFHSGYDILNIHFLAIPVYERHTSEVIFSAACEALDAMLPQWCEIIIGTSPRENKMTGRFSGRVTRFQMLKSLVIFEFGVARTSWTSYNKTCTFISVIANFMEYLPPSFPTFVDSKT
ncbi:hypothetical protein KXD40_008895 [Peronospora effusa]|nr:hypothetical protein KXD40_008895 [Peronospora effusa]